MKRLDTDLSRKVRPGDSDRPSVPLQTDAGFKKGLGVVVRSTLRAVLATTRDPFLNFQTEIAFPGNDSQNRHTTEGFDFVRIVGSQTHIIIRMRLI
ncbi:MAG: hypothetical protein FJ267_14105 [Planctomycetes bacterium]|nr:hypothetical protein [Planctomycetota bacterium]